ncbi:MAG: bifunctional tRNA (adenosine(37)-C2)-methyltransferase TrmG/ribosomal RNA large subunit methyltransferase RlmN, partial [Gammaproteobacteria bacterium]|nr:bifunctional tRNA (adenosine(37)-C2)-methyltransferase TrmG/ribosomal RNA large subunit methyltransferase RlmN [Gammaproteobacteria bacterium]
MSKIAAKPALLGFDRAGLTDLLVGLGGKPFHAKQVLKWLHARGSNDVRAMTDIATHIREKLATDYVIGEPQVLERFE